MEHPNVHFEDSFNTTHHRNPLKKKKTPISIASVNSEGKLELNRIALRDILTRDKRDQKKSVILSVTGPFRKGKSFLLSYFLRYLRYLRDNRSADWLDINTDDPVQGFEYKNQSNRVTTGILLWPKPFIVDDVAIYLMDTQGSFDAKQDTQDNTYILSLSTMVSGMTIFNLQGDLQQNYLEFLHYCTQYGEMAVKNKDEIVHRKLTFLIRDWEHIRSHEWGYENTGSYLNSFLGESGNQDESRNTIRRDLNSTFREMNCFLLPHPGAKVFLLSNFDGRVSFLDKHFLICLDEIISSVINNIKVNITLRTGEELFAHFSEYFDALTDDREMPPARSLYELTVDANRLRAFKLAKDEYHKVMKSKVGDYDTVLSESDLAEAHEEAKKAAREVLMATNKMGGNDGIEAYLLSLDNYIDKDGEIVMILNDDSRIKKKSKVVGITTVLGGMAVTASAGAVFAGTAATAATCATGGIAGLVIIAVGAAVVICGHKKKMPKIFKSLFSRKTKATLHEIKVSNNLVTEEVLSPTNEEQINSQNESPSNNDVINSSPNTVSCPNSHNLNHGSFKTKKHTKFEHQVTFDEMIEIVIDRVSQVLTIPKTCLL